MKPNRKLERIISIIFGILLAFSPIFTTDLILKNSEFTYDNRSEKDSVKTTAVSEKIYIDGNSDWAAFKAAGNCTGNGTYSKPYVIEDLVIDGEEGICISIENSNKYFKIENCTLYNFISGIYLANVSNALLLENNCSSTYYYSTGIYMEDSYHNNTLLGNILNCAAYGIRGYYGYNNKFIGNNITIDGLWAGIFTLHDYKDIISGNTISSSQDGIIITGFNSTITNNTINKCTYGIRLLNECDNSTISKNKMTDCGLILEPNSLSNRELEELSSHYIDSTNLVNGKPLYYYVNGLGLGKVNLTDAGQVILVNCNESSISNLNTSYCTRGISLYYSDNNNISGNTANYNYKGGIYLRYCDNNNISGNSANYNAENGILLNDGCTNNKITNNTANYNERDGIVISLSDHNTISENTANYNRNGIALYYSNLNIISGNILIGNDQCIVEVSCHGNTFSDNGDCTYGQGGIPIELIILILIIIGGAVISAATILFIIRKEKRKYKLKSS